MRMIVVSNRGPIRVGSDGRFTMSEGGLATALHPAVAASGGSWIWQWDRATGQRAAAAGALPDYNCQFVELEDEERIGFYQGLSNDVLWPVFHGFPSTSPLWDAPWPSYLSANRRFAEATSRAHRPGDAIWVQDYQLMLLPGLLREQAGFDGTSPIGWFCHIPWPALECFELLPWRCDILRGVLGADVVAFHTERYAENFLRCVAWLLDDAEVSISRREIVYRGRRVRVAACPIGIATESFRRHAIAAHENGAVETIRRALGHRRIILGVDRLDYSKGIVDRLESFGHYLRQRPDAARTVAYVQVAVPSRSAIPAYAQLKEEVERTVGRINGEFAVTGSVPIHYLYRSLSRQELVAHYASADVALVTPLRDGMNLVAQEYVASRVSGDGVLVLSEFAGAARHLGDALTVNPYDHQDVERALDAALEMSPDEQRHTMRLMQREVERLHVEKWGRKLVELLSDSVRPPVPSGIRQAKRDGGTSAGDRSPRLVPPPMKQQVSSR